MKHERHSKIVEIVGTYNIETQDELIDKLRDIGLEVTQATVSRDVKQLGLIKVSTKDNKYKYAMPSVSTQESMRISVKYRNIIRETIIGVDYAQNIVVIKTYAGMAQAAAAAIDNMNWDDVVGTIAGDDTILIIMRTSEKAMEKCHRFKDILNA